MNIRDNNFFWGAATSSYQVEGGITNNDWHFFTTNEDIKKRIHLVTKKNRFYKRAHEVNLEPAGDGVRTWDPEFYLKDFDNASKLGLNAIRISIEWSRIQPKKNEWDYEALNHYKTMIQSMREKKLNPVVTLNHFTLPLWISTPPAEFLRKSYQKFMPHPFRDLPLGEPSQSDPYWKSMRGWENQETVNMFISYVQKVVSELKDLVDLWITINEPLGVILGGYMAGIYPPGFFLNGKRAKKALHNLIEAHVGAYNTISDIDDEDADGDGISKQVGFAHLMVVAKPVINNSIFNRGTNIEAAKRFSYFMNDYFINAVTKGVEDINYLNTKRIGEEDSKDFLMHNEWKDKTDFIGINYYRSLYIFRSIIASLSSASFMGGVPINDHESHKQPHGILNDMGWELYPKGLYDSIMSIQNKWNKPVFVTENGLADKDDKLRAKFIISHIRHLKKGIEGGAKVMGYLHWSLLDNYEWQNAYDSKSRFGLFKVDRKDKSYQRHITQGAEVLKKIISLSSKDDNIISNSSLEQLEDEFGKIPESEALNQYR